jgi:hypothetical protein
MALSSQDLPFLTESLPQLQDYLLSNELYWPLGGSLPRLTLGSVLLALARLEIFHPVEAQQFRAQVEVVRVKWRSAWEKKAAREAANRLRLWSQFLSEAVAGLEPEAYPAEVRGRAILQLLLREAPETPEKAALAEVDGVLKAHLHPGAFIWEAELQTVFPQSDFWFLYATLAPTGPGRK